MLAVRALTKRFGGLVAVDAVTVAVAAHSIAGLIGPNGAGKSTLLACLTGFVRADRGTVHLQGRDMTGLPPERRAAAGLVCTFQTPRVFGGMTALENLMVAAAGQVGERFPQLFLRSAMVAAQEAAGRERALALLNFVGLEELADAEAGHLSAGQKKLLELARALMLSPRLLLLDEPTAGVSPALIRSVVAGLLRLREQGVTILLTEHNLDVVVELCDTVHVMAAGRILVSGPPAVIHRDPRVAAAYLGDVPARNPAVSGEVVT